MMASAVDFPQCDHLRSITAPSVFASEQAELIHINEQFSSLDRHISELNTLRSTLHSHTLQLHNQFSLINTLPIEVLSYILQLVIGPENYHRYPGGCYHWECLRQASVLSSVSSHFRHVAFGTSELWDRISLQIAEDKAIGNISSMLQHCIAHAPNISLCISERRSSEDCTNIRSVIETIITLETARKVKNFHFHGSTHVSMWIPEINAASFSMIETLTIECETGTTYSGEFDFGEMNNLTRLDINGDWLDFPIIVPPSLQYLNISSVSKKVFVSLLYQCPNLVDCSADIGTESGGPPFTKPLILNHLTRLRTGAINAITMSSSLQHLQLPSLEFLNLDSQAKGSLVPFCCSVSATLTSLAICMSFDEFKCRDVYALCRFTFPKLRVLKFTLFSISLLSAIHALSPLDGECNNLRPLHLPALKSISLYSDALPMAPRTLLDLLKNWWSDEALHLHLEFDADSYTPHKDWTPGLREELRSVVGRRQIEIIWGGFEI